jgi:hypothetical protein
MFLVSEESISMMHRRELHNAISYASTNGGGAELCLASLLVLDLRFC